MEQLTAAEQQWLVRAVVTIVLADDRLEQEELGFIKRICNVFLGEEPRETLEMVKSSLQKKEVPVLSSLLVKDADHLIYMLNTLAAAVFANGKKLRQEVEKFFTAGKKLGISYDILAYRLSLEADKNRIFRKLDSVEKDLKMRFVEKNSQ